MDVDTVTADTLVVPADPEPPRPINSLGADQCRVMARDAETLASWIMEHTAPIPISHHNLGYEVGAAVLHVDVCRVLGMPKMAYKVGGGLGYDTEQLDYAVTATHKAAELIATVGRLSKEQRSSVQTEST